MENKKLSTAIIGLMVAIGLSLLLYPTAANYVNTVAHRQAIDSFQRTMETVDEATVEDQLAAAREFNEHLLEKSKYLLFPFEVEHEEYLSLLDLTGTGLMGYVQVEKIDVFLPIYHGTSDEVLRSGVGHMEGSSLPIGGLGTHAVLTGHRGLPSATLFTDMDRMEVGDIFTVHVLREILTYEVDQLTVIQPEEAEVLTIDPEQDLCTLLTCTPYGVNSHRLLVRGHRIPTPEAAAEEQSVAERGKGWIYRPDGKTIAMVIVAAVLLGGVVMVDKWSRGKLVLPLLAKGVKLAARRPKVAGGHLKGGGRHMRR